MKKIYFGLIWTVVIVLLSGGCTEYEDEVYPIESYDAGVMTMLDYSDFSATETDTFFTDFLAIDSSMTVANYDSLLKNQSQLLNTLVDTLEMKGCFLISSINRRKVPVDGEVMMALIDLNTSPLKDYVIYMDSYMLLELYELNNGMKPVEMDNHFPLELAALTNTVKERFEAEMGNALYLLIMKVTEASKKAKNVGLIFTEADYEGSATVCDDFDRVGTAFSALSPADLDSTWEGETMNTAFLADSGVIDIVSDGLETGLVNTKYKVRLSKESEDGYFLVNGSGVHVFYADMPVQFSLFSLDSAGMNISETEKGVTLEEAVGCQLVSRFEFNLDKGTHYMVRALPPEGVSRFNMVVK